MAGGTNRTMVAYCGLICSDCGAFKKLKCEGCRSDKPMFRNCPVKECAADKNYVTCAECKEFENLERCRKLNNFISKLMGFVFRTDRISNLARIRQIGLEEFKSAD